MRMLPFLLMAGCLIGPGQTRERLDLDEDGSLWPDDCDDADPDVSPDAPEVLGDGIDNDCDDLVDEAGGGDTGDTGGDTGLPPIDGTAIFPIGQSWHFLDANDPPNFWLDAGYDFTVWPSGSGQLGYGDGDEATVLYQAGGNNRRAAVALIRSFEFAGTVPAELIVDLIADDGAVIYLNGVEVLRDNMPSGPIDFATYASSDREGDDHHRHIVAADALVEGTNVIAATVHQSGRQSSDLSFDLGLWIPN